MTHQKNLSQAPSPSQEEFLLLEEQDLAAVTGGSEQDLAAITGGSSLSQQIDNQINNVVHQLHQTNADKENKGVIFNQSRQNAKDTVKTVKAQNQYAKYKETRGVYYPR